MFASRLKPLALAATLAAAIAPAAAQDATEGATNYPPGSVVPLSSMNGFQAESVSTSLVGSGSAGAISIDAAVTGGSALMNDASGRSLMINVSESMAPVGDGTSITFPRSLSAPISADGTQVQFKAQDDGLGGVPAGVTLFDALSNPIMSIGSNGTANWNLVFSGAGAPLASSPSDVPTEFLIALNFTAQTCDVRARRLDTMADESRSGLGFLSAASNLAGIEFRTSIPPSPGVTNDRLLFNSIVVDSTGSLPVEISGFELE